MEQINTTPTGGFNIRFTQDGMHMKPSNPATDLHLLSPHLGEYFKPFRDLDPVANLNDDQRAKYSMDFLQTGIDVGRAQIKSWETRDKELIRNNRFDRKMKRSEFEFMYKMYEDKKEAEAEAAKHKGIMDITKASIAGFQALANVTVGAITAGNAIALEWFKARLARDGMRETASIQRDVVENTKEIEKQKIKLAGEAIKSNERVQSLEVREKYKTVRNKQNKVAMRLRMAGKPKVPARVFV